MFDKLKFWKKKDPFGIDDIKLDSSPLPTGSSSFDGGGMGSQNMSDSFGSNPLQDHFGQTIGNSGDGFNDPMALQQSQQPPSYEVHPVQNNNSFNSGSGGGNVQKDLEIISAKLDALKSTLEAINQRLTNIERIAQQDAHQQQPQNKRNWY